MLDKKLVILVGAVCVVEGWNLIWQASNILIVWRAQIPSNMPHLLEPATRINLMIEDPTDNESGIVEDMTGFNRRNFTHVAVANQDKCLGEVYRLGLVVRDFILSGKYLMLWCSTVAKLYLGYHPFIWGLTARITEDKVFRALCYFAFDNFLTRSIEVPMQFILVSLADPKSFADLQLNVTWNLIWALVSASSIYIWINLIEKIGITSWSFTPFAFGIADLLLPACVICSLKLKPPPPLPNDLKASLLALCTKLEYPHLKIRENITNHFPMVCYFNSLFNDIVIYSPLLLKRLSNDNVVAIFAHELGKKRYGYWLFYYLTIFARCGAVCYICRKAYDNIVINEMFGFLDDLPHPIMSLYLAHTYIEPLFMQVIEWTFNFLSRRYIFWCDHYACRLGYSSALKNALLALAGSSNRFPVFYDRWCSSFMSSVPGVQERVLEIELYDFYTNRQPN